MKLVAAMCALMWLPCSLAAQQPLAPVERVEPVPPTTLIIESRLVPVAVNVTDAAGLPVTGLKAADFEVAEDGVPQPIKVFDPASTTPLDIVLAIDTSESTFDDQRLERIAAEKFVGTLLKPEDRLDLLEFSDNVTELVPFTADKRTINAGLAHLQSGAATALYDAVYLAADRLRDAPATAPGGARRRAIVLITDGENTTHRGSYDDSMQRVLRAGAAVYALIIVPVVQDAGRDTGGEHALIQMAHDSGGKYFYVAEKRDLPVAFTHVSDDLRSQYTLGYYAPDTSRQRSQDVRQITVRLRDPALAAKYTLRYRTSYYAAAPRR